MTRRKVSSIAGAVFLFSAGIVGQQDSKLKTESKSGRVGLIELEATSHLEEGPIGGGNFDDFFQIKKARYYVPDLLDCSEKVSSAATKWAAAHDQTITGNKTESFRVQIFMKKPGTPGMYELLYRVDLNKGAASVTFYHLIQGIPSDPESEKNSGVGDLVPMLKEALTCVRPSSSSSH